MKRSTAYFLCYTAATIGLFAWALYDSLDKATEFFTLIVDMTDGYKLGILLNLLFLIFIGVGSLSLLLVFGSLRIIEIEHLVEKLPIFIINLLFNLTSNDNLIFNCILLGISVVFKVFHVVLTDRFDFVSMKIANLANNDSSITTKKVLRDYCANLYFWLLPLNVVADLSIAKFLVYDVFKGINSVTCLLFGFQFAVQGVELLTYYCKVLLNLYELLFFRSTESESDTENEEEAGEDTEIENEVEQDMFVDDDEDFVWERKAYYVKAVEIASSSLKAISYISFIYLLTVTSKLSLPISMLQGTYSSVVQTYKEIVQLFVFIESSKKLDTLLPNATREELESSDNLCIICREDMHSVEEYLQYNQTEAGKKRPISSRKYPKKLACSHIIHMGCLKDWLERSENCPLCRRKVFMTPEELQREKVLREEQTRMMNARQEAHNAQQERTSNGDSGENTDSSQPPESDSFDIVPSPDHDGRQTLVLPSSVQIPPNWTPLPIERDGNDYKISFSNKLKGKLTLKRRARNGEEMELLRGSPLERNGGSTSNNANANEA
ncbi:ERAD-associated E3 ubiquitin-protein ligase Hrd1p [[Candida] railenensis]|uniref:ERAD-associated E3 ubiquitin-protein ligase Hrd1p n=1 Tax=[Candida] railenensis TaxID=45579 RepID=A0A9P0QQC9_9ASCO|nr:ERAD-associated E3 ubiquitin-protein ligase Hrd1p [[Candida] railenensis]